MNVVRSISTSASTNYLFQNKTITCSNRSQYRYIHLYIYRRYVRYIDIWSIVQEQLCFGDKKPKAFMVLEAISRDNLPKSVSVSIEKKTNKKLIDYDGDE